MDQDLTTSIKRALELIRSGKLDAARPILLEVLREDETIEQAWFLLSYTLPPGDKQEYALNQALSMNPEFDRAQERLDRIRGVDVEPATQPILADREEPVEGEELPSKEDGERYESETVQENGIPFTEKTFFDGEDLEVESGKTSFPKRTLAIAGLVILFLIILFLATSPGILTNLFGFEQGGQMPTQVQGFRTLPPTWTP